MSSAKYIVSSDGRMIVFSAALNHSDFKKFNPISAGFIAIGLDKEGNPDCTCYGKSESLGIGAGDQDSAIAKFQIINY